MKQPLLLFPFSVTEIPWSRNRLPLFAKLTPARCPLTPPTSSFRSYYDASPRT